jgi:hypothetical protein
MALVIEYAVRRAITGCRVNTLQRIALSQNRGLSSCLIPDATWSIKDLELTSTHAPISQLELDRLSRRCLLDIPKDSTIPQDLSNMLHMVRQVQSTTLPTSLTSVEIYDTVRGVTAAPLRDVQDPLEQQDSEQAQQVYKSLLQPKTKRLGGTEYFAIKTKGN